jgi:hypothetical protein
MERVMNVFVRVAAAGCLLFSAVVATAASKPAGSPAASPRSAPSLLFAMKAKKATIQPIQGNKYQLTIPLKALEPVLAFSDRPYRLAFRMKAEEFLDLVHSGDDSFDKNWPNIVLNWEAKGRSAAVYTMLAYKRNKDDLVYTLRLVSSQKEEGIHEEGKYSGRLGLFIDAKHMDPVKARNKLRARSKH